MSKKSRRPGRAARDAHDRIKAMADALLRSPTFGVRDADETPELAALMNSARRRIEQSLPSSFEHEGRTYYLRTRLALRFDVYDEPGRTTPLLSGMSVSLESFGHAPAH